MMEDPELEKRIEEIIERKIQERLELVQLETLRKEFLTREEFLDAMKQMDHRFEAMDQRFEEMLKASRQQFEEIREENKQQFEAINQRFEEMREENKQQFEEMREENKQQFEANHNEQIRLRAFMDNIGNRSGIALQHFPLYEIRYLINKIGFFTG